MDETLARCRERGLRGWLVPGTRRKTWEEVLALGRAHRDVHIALGLHPYFVKEHRDEDLEELDELLGLPEVCALGECGLDATLPDMQRQKSLLIGQVEIALRRQLPVILHSRKTHSELLGILKAYLPVAAVVHAFSGSVQEMEAFVQRGVMLGVGPVIVWPRATKTCAAIAAAPLTSLLLETDAPDMPLPGQAKGQASPVGLLQVFERLCQLRPESPKEIAQQLWCNSERFLGCVLSAS